MGSLFGVSDDGKSFRTKEIDDFMCYGFQPWIGRNYQQNGWGRRVLILGESHYQWDENVPIDNDPTLTIECVEKQPHTPGRFWTGIAIAFLNPPPHCRPNPDKKRTFWHSVAFYNYIQQCVGFGPGPNPTPAMWRASQPAFHHFLDTYQPQGVIVLGRPNWANIQGLDGQGGPHIEGARYEETRWLQHAGGRCLAYGIEHPSHPGFNGRCWPPFIMRALRYADGPH